MQYSKSTNAIPSLNQNSGNISPVPNFAKSYSKNQIATRTTDSLNSQLLQEAFNRALSGTKVGRITDPQINEVGNEHRKHATAQLLSQNANMDFSNNYVAKRQKSKNEPENYLDRPAFMQRYNFQPKQVYLYERTDQEATNEELHMNPEAAHDRLFVQLEDPEAKYEAANCGAQKVGGGPEGHGVEDSTSQETKSQLTDFSNSVQRLKSHTLLQQPTQGPNHRQAHEDRDAKMAQQAMIKRRNQMTQEHDGAASHISEINFYQDLQDNGQFQNENGPEESGNDLVVLDVDTTGTMREQVLANKRPTTAYSHDACHPGGAPSTGPEARKRCTQADKEQYLQQMSDAVEYRVEPQQDLYRVDYQNDLLNIVAQKPDERVSLGEPSEYDEVSPADSNRVQAQQPINQHYDHELGYSRDSQYAGAIQRFPGRAAPVSEPTSGCAPPSAIHHSEAGQSVRSYVDTKQKASVAERLRQQNQGAEQSRWKKLAQGFIAGTASGQHRAANGRSSRQNAGMQQTSDRRHHVNPQQVPKTPTSNQKAWSSSQSRLSYKAPRERSQVSGAAVGTAATRLQKSTLAGRTLRSPGAAMLTKSPGLAKSQSGRVGEWVQAAGPKATISGKLLQAQPQTQKAVTAEQIRSDMVTAFGKIRLDIYGDILRIKKPQSSAFKAAQMLCKVVNSFRGGSQKTNNDALFQDWAAIQDFVHRKPNVIKFHQEITQLIQHMILSQDYLNQLRHGQLKNHLNKLMKIQDQYFGLSTHEQVLRQFQTNKNFQQIVNLCFTIGRYVLYEAGKSELLNLGQHECADAEETTAHGTSRTFLSNKRSSNSTHCGNSQSRNGTYHRGSAQRQIGEGYRGNPASDYTPQRETSTSQQQQNEMAHHYQLSASFSQDQSASRKVPVKNSGAKSPLIPQNIRNITKTPRNENNMFQRMCAKSPMTQKYDIKSLGSASRSFKGTGEHQLIGPQRLQTFGPRGSHADENPHNKSSGTSGYYQPSVPSGSSPQKHRMLQGSQGRHSVEERQQNSNKMYELLLQKQRQITHDRYERLTTSSVSKHATSKRLQTTPGGERPGASEPTSTLKERPNVNAFTVDQDTPTQHTLITTPMKSEVITPLKAPTNPESVKDPKHTMYQVETFQENGYNTVYTAYEEEVKFEGRSRDGNSHQNRLSTRSGVRQLGDQGKPRKSRKDRSERKATASKVVQIAPGQLEYDDVVSGRDKPTNLAFAEAVMDNKQQDESNLDHHQEDQVQETTEVLEEEKNADTFLPLQMQEESLDTSTEQLEAPQVREQPSMAILKQASIDGFIDGPRITESSEENPDVDILEQMQMVAPAPLPQPAPPLALTQGALSSCFDNTSEAPIEETDLAEQQPRDENPADIDYDQIGVGIISQVPIDLGSISRSIDLASKVESSPEPKDEYPPENEPSEQEAIPSADEKEETVTEEPAEESAEVEAEAAESPQIQPESPDLEEAQSEQEYDQEEDQLQEESSPDKESTDFDPFAEAQRIAAIIKAGCLANLASQEPEQQNSYENEANEDAQDHEVSTVKDGVSGAYQYNLDNERHIGSEEGSRILETPQARSAGVSAQEEVLSEEKVTAQNSPAQVEHLQKLEVADEEVDEEPLPHFRAIVKIPEDVRLSVQSLGNQTVQVSKDNFIQYKQENQLMESLCMSSLEFDFSLDNERKDQREMTIACPGKSENGRIHLEQSIFDQHLDQSVDTSRSIERGNFQSQKKQVPMPNVNITNWYFNEASRDQTDMQQESIYDEQKLSQQAHQRSEDEKTQFEKHCINANQTTPLDFEADQDCSTQHDAHEFSKCNAIDDLSMYDKMTPRTARNLSVDQVVITDDVTTAQGEQKMRTAEKEQPEAVEEEDAEESETQSPQKTGREVQQPSSLMEQSQSQTMEDIDEDVKKDLKERKINEDDVCRSHSDSKSSGDSELCMQEILSPFRQLNSYSSPQRKPTANGPGAWAINPIQIQRDCLLAVDENKSEGHLTQSEYSSIIYSSPGGQGSPCESPVRQDRFLETVYRSSPVISPGKLKTHIIQSRAAIFEQIMETQQKIEANSPTKHSAIDQSVINSIKRRRIAQRRAKSKPVAGEYRVELPMEDPNWGQNPWIQTRKRMTEYQDDVIQKLKETIASKNQNVNSTQTTNI